MHAALSLYALGVVVRASVHLFAGIVLEGAPHCTLYSDGCEMMPGAGVGGLLPSNPTFRFATCMCHPTRFQTKQLEWTPGPCIYTPFYPPPPVDVQLVV